MHLDISEMEYNKRMFDYTFGVMDEFKRAIVDKANSPEKVHFAWKTFLHMYKHARNISDVIDEEESALAQIICEAEDEDYEGEEEDYDDEEDEEEYDDDETDEDYQVPDGEAEEDDDEEEVPVEPEPAADLEN